MAKWPVPPTATDEQVRVLQTGGTGPLQPGRRIGDVAVLVHIKAIFNETKDAYGWPRIWRELAARARVPVGKEHRRYLSRGRGKGLDEYG